MWIVQLGHCNSGFPVVRLGLVAQSGCSYLVDCAGVRLGFCDVQLGLQLWPQLGSGWGGLLGYHRLLTGYVLG